MRRFITAFVFFVIVGVLVSACNGTTGDQLITFQAYAAGAKGAGEPFSSNGYTIQLTYAKMYVGALYVNEAPAQNGSTFDTPVCIDEGIYCAQVTNGLDVDLLSTTPQAFPEQGTGSADLGQSWQLYLVDGDVNQPENQRLRCAPYGGPDRDRDARVGWQGVPVGCHRHDQRQQPRHAGAGGGAARGEPDLPAANHQPFGHPHSVCSWRNAPLDD